MNAVHRDIDVVLFDVGGVLVELNGIETLLSWLDNGMTVEQVWVRWLRSTAVRQFETGLTDENEFAFAVTREFELNMDPARFLESFERWPIGVYPGVTQMLGRIPSRFRRALLSNSNALHWPRIMRDMGLGEAFERRFVSHLTGKIKPDRDAFEDVVDTLGCAPAQVLFLDDNKLNVDGAKDFGMHAVRVVGPREAQRVLIEFGIIEGDADTPAG